MTEEWICKTCCWWDGKITCLKGGKWGGKGDLNFDGDGIKGVTGCAHFVEIEEERGAS